MFDRKCKIIFINHGSTIYTDQQRLYDLDDYPPISDKGRKEINKIADWLKITNQSVDKIYTNSSLRTLQSARLVAKLLKKDFEVLHSLYERRTGVWGGLTLLQIRKKYPQAFELYQKNPCNFHPEDGESILNINERVKNTINGLVKENYRKRIIIITHTNVIQSAIGTAIGIPPENQEKVYIPTGSATQINYYEEWSSLVYSAYVPI